MFNCCARTALFETEYLASLADEDSAKFSERQKVEIDSRVAIYCSLANELSLSLFRVLQEALRNAMKHSGVKRFEVRLGSTGEIHLTVSDLV